MLQVVFDLKTSKEISRKAWADPTKDVGMEAAIPFCVEMAIECQRRMKQNESEEISKGRSDGDYRGNVDSRVAVHSR